MANKKQKPYWQMNAKELAEATKDYDKPFVFEETRPLTSEMRTRLRRARAKGGRPRIGKGARVISLTVERGLLEKADALARKRGVTRARLFADGLTMLLAKAG